MDKTIKQLADDYGMTKQAMHYHVKKLSKSCINFDSKNGTKILMVNDKGQELLRSWLSKRQTEEVSNFAVKNEIIELRHKLEIKELENKNYLEKIELLQKRSEEDKERMDRILKSLDQAQQLQAIAEQKIRMLERKEQEQSTGSAAEPEPESQKNAFRSKSIFNLFRKGREDN